MAFKDLVINDHATILGFLWFQQTHTLILCINITHTTERQYLPITYNAL